MSCYRDLEKLYKHLVKRIFDEYAIEITEVWEKSVLNGEHDVPLPIKELTQ